jgi:DnaB-like helicase C terminal domain
VIETVLAKFPGARRGGRGWMARCPGHDDRTASLTISVGTDGRALLNCFAGCKPDDIIAAVGLSWPDLFTERSEAPRETKEPHDWPLKATYTYRDRDGNPVYRVERRVSADSGRKTFRQFRSTSTGWVGNMDGVTRVLYRLPELQEAHAGARVFVVEGEQCADDLAALGALATTNVGGAGKWLPEYDQCFWGLDVVVLPDNDEPGEKHAAAVALALKGAAASVKVVRLPHLPAKGDVSDWLRSGRTLTDLEGICRQPEAIAPQTFAPSVLRVVGERQARLAEKASSLRFGIEFLDDALGGIAARDLVLVGARTGSGKTQLATLVALANTEKGKRVHYFALEAEDNEIERRIKWQALARIYYRNAISTASIRYLDWRLGRIEGFVGRHEDAADVEVASTLKNLHTFYRCSSFTGDDFAKQLRAIREETDLVILDHLHYVDNDDRDENRGYKRLVKQIRDAAIESGKPVLVVAHVKKSDKRQRGIVPELEDFHGSSDIPKIATKAIMLAPDFDTKTGNSSMWSTYIQVVKCRLDSSVTRYVARCVYDASGDRYTPGYVLGRPGDGGTSFCELPEADWPQWHRPRERHLTLME